MNGRTSAYALATAEDRTRLTDPLAFYPMLKKQRPEWRGRGEQGEGADARK
jgi:hypothetical protein